MGVGSRNYTIYYSILAVAYAIQAGLTLIVIVGPLKHCKDICPLSYTLRRAEYIKHNWVSSLDHSIPHKEPNRTGSCINGKDDLGVACNYYPLSERQAYQTGAVFMTNEDSGKAQFNKGRRLRRYDLLSCGAAKPQSQWVYPGSGDIKVVDTLRDDESKVGKLRQLRGVYGPQVSGFPAFLTPDEINARNPELKVKQYMPAGIVADRARFGNVSYQEARYNVETKLWPIARMLSPAGGSFQTAKDIWDYAVWTEDASEDVNKYNEGRDDKQQYKPFPLWGGYTMEEFLGVPSKAGEYEQLQESSNLPKLRAMGENSFLWTALRKDRNFCLQCRNDNSSQLWEPCDDFDDCRNGFMDGFRVSDFPLDLSLRARPFMAPFFIAALGLFTVELAGAIVCAIGLSYFAKLQTTDFKKFSACQLIMGVFTRFFPKINKPVNILAGMVLLALFAMIVVIDVCDDAKDPATGQFEFYPTARLTIIFNIGLWVALQFAGTSFRNTWTSETAFHVPRAISKTAGTPWIELGFGQKVRAACESFQRIYDRFGP